MFVECAALAALWPKRAKAPHSKLGARLLAGDLFYYFIKLARSLPHILHGDALVVAVNAFIFFGRRVKRHPAVSDNTELPIELTFSVTAQHLCCDYGIGIVLFRLASDKRK